MNGQQAKRRQHQLEILSGQGGFSQEPAEQIKAAFHILDASIEEGADICAKIPLFPRFPLTIKLWLGDDEIKGSANILFDISANHYLDTEAINEAGIMVSYFFIKQYELMYKSIQGEMQYVFVRI